MGCRKPTFCICGDHAFAPITRGYVTLVSPEDAGLLEFAWSATAKRSAVYAQRTRDHKCVKLHREILSGVPIVDHANHNGLDNRRTNIRAATASQNTANRKGVVGVHVRRKNGRFRALIKENGRNKHLGYFATFEEAKAVRDAAALEKWGSFAPVEKAHG